MMAKKMIGSDLKFQSCGAFPCFFTQKFEMNAESGEAKGNNRNKIRNLGHALSRLPTSFILRSDYNRSSPETYQLVNFLGLAPGLKILRWKDAVLSFFVEVPNVERQNVKQLNIE
jgi:hypothetical protein